MSIKQFEKIALSNFDILKLLDNKCNIVLYPNIHKYKDIDELLGSFGVCIILYETQPKYGHWIAILKTDKDSIEYFNPYGGVPDNALDSIPKKFKISSNQNLPYLSVLMHDSRYNLYYNEFRFQKLNKNIKTCGRHCVVRVLCENMDIYEYYYFLSDACRRYNTDFDGVVTIFTTPSSGKTVNNYYDDYDFNL